MGITEIHGALDEAGRRKLHPGRLQVAGIKSHIGGIGQPGLLQGD